MPKRSDDYKAMFSPPALRLAWERYVRSAQREAKDYLGIRAFRDNLDANLQALSKMVLTGEYAPSRPPKYFKCKSSGMQRTITILPLMDSLVFQAIADHVAAKTYPAMVENHEFVFGSVLHDEVPLGVSLLEKSDAEFYFFQPWQLLYKKFADSVNKAVKELQVEYKFETDITGFYDNIPHYNLLAKTAAMAGTPDDVLDLLTECLNYWSGTRDRPTPGVGIPQATVASHFFANLFLHDLDDLMKDQGLPYYRYMDDMRIYGYGHDQLQKVLIRVDRHLKQHALSLNAKKTAIEEITPDKEAEALILFQYNAELEPAAETPSDEFFSFAAQDGAGYEGPAAGQLSAASKELIALCYRDIAEVKERIAQVSTAQGRKDIDFDDRSVQREFMSLGFRFRQAVQILRDAGRKPRLPKGKTLKGWLYLVDHYFWFMNHFLWVLRFYENDDRVKKALLALVSKYDVYEWVQSELYQCLALSQMFTARELRSYYNQLKKPTSWYAKRGIYLLLLHHSRDKQFFRSILSRASQESEGPLRREIMFMAHLWEKNGVEKEHLLEAFGLA